MVPELQQRLELATPDKLVRGISINAVVGVFSQHLGKDRAASLIQRVGKRSPVDFFNYPARTFLELQEDGIPELLRVFGTVEKVRQAYGAASLSGFFESAVGKTLLNIVGRGDPKRLLANAATAYGTQINYGKREFVADGERSGFFTMRGDFFWPDYHVGVLTAAIRTMGVAEASVTAKVLSLTDVDYHCSWSAAPAKP